MEKPKASKDIDGYISQFPADVQAILEKVRATIRRAAPEAQEAISYQMPAFKQHGILVYFAAWKKHIGLYPPISGDKAIEKAVSRFAGPKGNLQFPLDEPIPYDLIERIVKLRVKQDEAKATAKRKKSPEAPKMIAQFIIFVEQNGAEVMMSAPLEKDDQRYFEKAILPNMKPLSDDDYSHGPAMILRTLARFSYVLFGEDLYWCAEWEPGLIVVRFSPHGSLAWTALRSPIPNFGGRKPKKEDTRSYNEDAENHQYNLVFRAWDAQFDEFWRKHRAFVRSSKATAESYWAALDHANKLAELLEARYSKEPKYSKWLEKCKRNLKRWTGDGIRVSM